MNPPLSPLLAACLPASLSLSLSLSRSLALALSLSRSLALSLSLSSSPGHEGLLNPLGRAGPPDVRGALEGV